MALLVESETKTALDSPGVVSKPEKIAAPAVPPARLLSLDAYRGAIMLLMASGGLAFSQVAKSFPNNPVWQFLGRQTDHVPWTGCVLWDLIQPAFMFMVGVALPWSIANRRARGESFGRMFLHALWRALFLVLLAVFLTSAWSKQTDWIFTNVLAQIGLGYPFLFLFAFTRPRIQWVAAFLILGLYWLAFALYPLPSADFPWQSVGLSTDWLHLTGFAAHWEKNANFASAFDQWFLNLFPRATPFVFNNGGYQTLNFIPSLATMTFGLLAGQLLRSDRVITQKLKILVIAGCAGILLGVMLSPLCPIVKRIWTPSWALFSAGWVTLILAGFVAVIDWQGKKSWAFPLIVAGLNPITLYVLWQISGPFIRDNFKRHLGENIFSSLGTSYELSLQRGTILLVMWLVLYWMYRKKIFIRV
jgi:heparan-alpha-glucosaminide N-acetyltransferase